MGLVQEVGRAFSASSAVTLAKSVLGPVKMNQVSLQS